MWHVVTEQESSESVSVRLEQENRRLLKEKLRLDAENDVLARRIDHVSGNYYFTRDKTYIWYHINIIKAYLNTAFS